jgi:hypothetical protein
VELPEPAKPPDPRGGSNPESGVFAMTLSSYSRTERTANLRRIFEARRTLNQSELDSHADTCVAGGNTKVINFTDTKVNVSPFSDSYKAIKDVPIATVATAWDDQGTGEVIILYIHEALYLGCPTRCSAQINFVRMDGLSRTCRSSSMRSQRTPSLTPVAVLRCLWR